jgi:hypothetical protein
LTAATAAPATLCDWQGKNRSPAIKAYIKTLAGEFSKFCACAHRCWRQPEGLSALHCYNFTATPLPSAIVNRYTFSDICDPNHTKKGDAIAIVDVVDQQWQYARGQPVTPSPLEQTVICGFISSYCTSDDKFVMIQVISTCVYSAASNFHSPRGARFQLVQPGFAGATKYATTMLDDDDGMQDDDDGMPQVMPPQSNSNDQDMDDDDDDDEEGGSSVEAAAAAAAAADEGGDIVDDAIKSHARGTALQQTNLDKHMPGHAARAQKLQAAADSESAMFPCLKLAVGRTVQIHGLTGIGWWPQNNGKIGKVSSYDEHNGRYSVVVAGESLSVRAGNLRVVPPRQDLATPWPSF